MATKNNIRSIRFSDELAELIEQQEGKNFQQKFENLVRWCVQELPKRERELESINHQIYEKRQQLGRLSNKANNYARALRDMEHSLTRISNAIALAQEHEM